MRWHVAAVILPLLAGLAPAQDQQAEKLCRDFEKRLVSAKSFRLAFELNPDRNFPKAKGDLTLAAGNTRPGFC